MPEIIETTVYQLDELSNAAKDEARAWYRQADFDHDWFERICAILGVELRTLPVRLYGAGAWQRRARAAWIMAFVPRALHVRLD